MILTVEDNQSAATQTANSGAQAQKKAQLTEVQQTINDLRPYVVRTKVVVQLSVTKSGSSEQPKLVSGELVAVNWDAQTVVVSTDSDTVKNETINISNITGVNVTSTLPHLQPVH